jgi:hypothetical protein
MQLRPGNMNRLIAGLSGSMAAFPLELAQQWVETGTVPDVNLVSDMTSTCATGIAGFFIFTTIAQHVHMVLLRGVCGGIVISPIVAYCWGGRVARRSNSQFSYDVGLLQLVCVRETILMSIIFCNEGMGMYRTFVACVMGHLLVYPLKIVAMNRIVDVKPSLMSALMESLRASVGLVVSLLTMDRLS